MFEHKTEKGTILYCSINYDLGGYSYITNRDMPRGYYLSVRRKRNEFVAHEGLNHEKGAVRAFIHEVQRKSNKQEQIAEIKAKNKIIEILENYDI